MGKFIQEIASDYSQERALAILVNTYEFILKINLKNPQELQQAASLNVYSDLCLSNSFRDKSEEEKAKQAIENHLLDTFKKRIQFGTFSTLIENNITQLPDYSSCANV